MSGSRAAEASWRKSMRGHSARGGELRSKNRPTPPVGWRKRELHRFHLQVVGSRTLVAVDQHIVGAHLWVIYRD